MRSTRRAWAAVAVALGLVVTACSSDGGGTGTDDGGDATTTDTGTGGAAGGGGVSQRDLRFVVVSHGQSSDPFWSVASRGVEDAGSDMGVQVEYQAPGTFDMVEMSQIIDAAVGSNPDGLVVTIPDAEALGDSIQSAVDAGIPVISMNSGSDVFSDLGVLAHVGQTEREAGVIAGQRMAEEGVSNAVCVNQEVGNVALDLRCEGFEEGLGGSVEVVPVELADPAGTQATMEGVISSRSPDGILTLGPTGAIPTLAALEGTGQLGEVQMATFDLSEEVLQALTDGNMLFAIDQAQYLQGYLPIVYLTKFIESGAIPLGGVDGVTMTGPQLVTPENAEQVIEFQGQGVR